VPLGRIAQRLLSVTRKCLGLVECLVVLQTVVELADTFVEQVAGGGGVAVAVFSPAAVVLAGGLAVGGGRERPHPADVGVPVVLDTPVRDRQGSSRGAGDGCGSRVGLQRPGVGEPGTAAGDVPWCAARLRPGILRDTSPGDYGADGR
jgi:hypothetical protein